jgi:hypothetical protein
MKNVGPDQDIDQDQQKRNEMQKICLSELPVSCDVGSCIEQYERACQQGEQGNDQKDHDQSGLQAIGQHERVEYQQSEYTGYGAKDLISSTVPFFMDKIEKSQEHRIEKSHDADYLVS